MAMVLVTWRPVGSDWLWNERFDEVYSGHGLLFIVSQEHGIVGVDLPIKVQAIVGAAACHPDAS